MRTAKAGSHYAGLRAWTKYNGVTMPSRPAEVTQGETNGRRLNWERAWRHGKTR